MLHTCHLIPSHATHLVYDHHTHYFNLIAGIKSNTNLFPAPPQPTSFQPHHTCARVLDIWSGMQRMQMLEAPLLSHTLLSSHTNTEAERETNT